MHYDYEQYDFRTTAYSINSLVDDSDYSSRSCEHVKTSIKSA